MIKCRQHIVLLYQSVQVFFESIIRPGRWRCETPVDHIDLYSRDIGIRARSATFFSKSSREDGSTAGATRPIHQYFARRRRCRFDPENSVSRKIHCFAGFVHRNEAPRESTFASLCSRVRRTISYLSGDAALGAGFANSSALAEEFASHDCVMQSRKNKDTDSRTRFAHSFSLSASADDDAASVRLTRNTFCKRVMKSG